MRVEIVVDATDAQGRTFLGWAPRKGRVRLLDAAPALVEVTLRGAGGPGGGRLVFDLARGHAGADELRLSLAGDGTPSEFWVGGAFGHPSAAYGDVAIEVAGADAAILARLPAMVRVRRNAVHLSPAERDRFLNALGTLNDRGQGPFQSFRDTHVVQSVDEAHGFAGFPWHRAYVLDLERTLQAIDPSVALPYWRFDEPAPALFAPDFLGMPPADPDDGDVVQFPHGHPLEFWRTDTNDPIERRPIFDVAGPPPRSARTPEGVQPLVISQDDTLALGEAYAQFRTYEGAPHGFAHTSFRGPIARLRNAAKDPLFFLLHANVDRLWAVWQWVHRRWDVRDPATYSLDGPRREPDDVGHKPGDTMWPWNGAVAPPRPTFPPPRGRFPASALVRAPSATPTVAEMIDYQGVLTAEPLGFDYDDVPFEALPGDLVA